MKVYTQSINNLGEIKLKIMKTNRMPLVIKVRGITYYISEDRRSLSIISIDGPMKIKPEVSNRIRIDASRKYFMEEDQK